MGRDATARGAHARAVACGARARGRVWRSAAGPGLAFALAVALLALTSVGAPWGAWPSVASAQEATSTPAPTPTGTPEPIVALFLGFVGPDEEGLLPTHVRAIGTLPDGTRVTCGTAEVVPSGEGLGFYLIDVVSSSTREGCPPEGGVVRFLLMYGEVDEGRLALETGTWLPRVQRLDLSLLPEGLASVGFVGILPAEPGFALVQWTGPNDTPIEHAAATLERVLLGAWRFEGVTISTYIPGAPDFVSNLDTLATGDVILVRVN